MYSEFFLIVIFFIRKQRNHVIKSANEKNVPLFYSLGLYSTPQLVSPPEGQSYAKPREGSWWGSRHRSGAPGLATDRKGHYRDRHQPETDSDLLMEEGHDSSTQIVVELLTAKRGYHLILSCVSSVMSLCLRLWMCLWFIWLQDKIPLWDNDWDWTVTELWRQRIEENNVRRMNT